MKMLNFIYCQKDKVSYNAMHSMTYEVYHWYGMKEGHHTSAKHFQMIILHIPHFERTQAKSTRKACKAL